MIQSGASTTEQLYARYDFRGRAYTTKGLYDQAIADFTEAIKLDPRREMIYAARGSAYYYQGQFDAAIADFNKMLTLKPRYADGYNYGGVPMRGRASPLRRLPTTAPR